MSEDVKSYWPDDFGVKVLTPVAVLRIQSEALSRATHGLLEADVVSASTKNQVSHELQLVAPALGGERRTVLTVTHQRNEPYPATLDAPVFEPADEPDGDPRPVASTMQEFTALVKRVLQSKEVRAAAQSLLARSQEVPA
jgi:hypothetical protein